MTQPTTLYDKWKNVAYDGQGAGDKKFWAAYIPLEQRIYEDMLEAREGRLSGTVSELAERYGMKPEYVAGFLDGIKDALNEALELDEVDESYRVDISFDFERLFKKMVEYKAKHLYTLPQWDGIFSEEQRDVFIDEQRRSGIVVKGDKIGRNDPCPCGSGKKYKKCCGASL